MSKSATNHPGKPVLFLVVILLPWTCLQIANFGRDERRNRELPIGRYDLYRALGLPKESLDLAEGLRGAPTEYRVIGPAVLLEEGRLVQDSASGFHVLCAD
jgi:hypothetical protein